MTGPAPLCRTHVLTTYVLLALRVVQSHYNFVTRCALAEKIGDVELVQQLQVSLGMARANALIGHVARGYVSNTAKDLAVALQWCSLRRDGFTGGAITTGFEP